MNGVNGVGDRDLDEEGAPASQQANGNGNANGPNGFGSSQDDEEDDFSMGVAFAGEQDVDVVPTADNPYPYGVDDFLTDGVSRGIGSGHVAADWVRGTPFVVEQVSELLVKLSWAGAMGVRECELERGEK